MDVFPPFDSEFFILLNLAMGGNLGGPIASNFSEDQMEIDYVRVYQESPLGLADLDKNTSHTRLYPNPVSDVLNIEIRDVQDQKLDLSVFDISGRLISESKSAVYNQQLSYSIRSLNAGIYFLNIRLADGYQTKLKFIKI